LGRHQRQITFSEVAEKTLDNLLGFNYIYQYNLIYLIINFNLIKQNKRRFGPGCGNLAENMAIKVLSLFSTKGGDMANPEMTVAQKRSFLGSLPAAIWLLSAAIMAYGAIMIIGSLVFQIGVAEPRQPIVQL
jgi:hypothetical protein